MSEPVRPLVVPYDDSALVAVAKPAGEPVIAARGEEPSGGETSRLMLGLKSVLARADRTPTLIFDEIDQGIGGRVGSIVGLKLWNLARQHQVLCVTHLPQLAAYADQHFRVEKVQRAGRTFTTIGPLSKAERLTELAMMPGGTGEANSRSAAELVAHADSDKRARPSG